mmetsp:Transcript_8208/g.30276  ORF Transcript_8208/g.30276 Transcript_8208/m.30276 type:complete len:391 (-) Transcript_8208:17-1189(-)
MAAPRQRRVDKPSAARRRRNKAQASVDAKPEAERGAKGIDPDSKELSETLAVLRNLGLLTVLVLTPYALKLAYDFYHFHSGLTRPVVAPSDQRQVLIMGLQGAGTSQMSKRLSELGIEVGHESSNAEDQFCRDGTISWLHAIEAFNHTMDIELLCSEPRHRLAHSTQFEQSPCSYRVPWDACWARQCRTVFGGQSGCLHKDSCTTPFAKRLLQVRHPLNNIATLVIKYCADEHAGTLPHALKLAVLESLYPHVQWGQMKGGCIEVFATYWAEYNSRLAPWNNPMVDAWYRVEDTTPCQVAGLAGFLSEDGAASEAYPPTRRKAMAACEKMAGSDQETRSDAAVTADTRAHGQINRVNKDLLKVSYEDIAAAGGAELAARVEDLGRALGYV